MITKALGPSGLLVEMADEEIVVTSDRMDFLLEFRFFSCVHIVSIV